MKKGDKVRYLKNHNLINGVILSDPTDDNKVWVRLYHKKSEKTVFEFLCPTNHLIRVKG